MDTTGVEIGEWVDRRRQGINIKNRHRGLRSRRSLLAKQSHSQPTLDYPKPTRKCTIRTKTRSATRSRSCRLRSAFSLNARLLHAAALREQGNANVPMDPEWEQYLKEAQERGELNIDATREALRNMAGQIAQLHQSQVSPEGNVANVTQQFQPPAAPA